MIPPLNEEEYERLIPTWAKILDKVGIPLIVGLPIYDVLYGPKFGSPFWTVTHVHKDGQGIGAVCRNSSSSCGAAMHYFVPDVTTPEGARYALEWFDNKVGEWHDAVTELNVYEWMGIDRDTYKFFIELRIPTEK